LFGSSVRSVAGNRRDRRRALPLGARKWGLTPSPILVDPWAKFGLDKG